MSKISKVVRSDGQVLIDLTQDTITKEKLLKGATAHGPDGEEIIGECEYDVKSADVTAAVGEVLAGKTFAKGGKVLVGEMPNKGGVIGKISSKDGAYNIEPGYHDGSGKVEIDATEKAKLIPENIRQGISVLGVEGTMSGSEDEKKQSKEVTPSFEEQTVLPDSGYTCLAEVKVNPIPYVETPNSAGGITVTIG